MIKNDLRHPLILKRIAWPDPDRLAREALFAEGDILDGAGPCCRWSEGSRKKREQTYGHWLGHCLSQGAVGQQTDVADRATEEAVRGFVEAEMARCSLRTVYMHADDLLFVLRAMCPDKDWAWLARIVGRLRANCTDGELKPRLGVSAHEIFAWALKRIESIDRNENSVPEVWRAARFRDALMVGLLIATTLRLRTFIAIDVEKHVTARPSGFVLSFGPGDMKDRRPHEFELPAQLMEPMRRYLLEFRKVLLRGNSSTRLWITQCCEPLSYGGFQKQLPRLTLKQLGLRCDRMHSAASPPRTIPSTSTSSPRSCGTRRWRCPRSTTTAPTG
jgi:integrase/recombinase XerD